MNEPAYDAPKPADILRAEKLNWRPETSLITASRRRVLMTSRNLVMARIESIERAYRMALPALREKLQRIEGELAGK